MAVRVREAKGRNNFDSEYVLLYAFDANDSHPTCKLCGHRLIKRNKLKWARRKLDCYCKCHYSRH